MPNFQQCFDETNPRTECLDKISGKGCVEPGMGGHPGAFTDVQLDNCKIACGKKASKDSKTELAFYDDLYSRDDLPENLEALKKFIPKYYAGEKCSKGDNGYFVIENIKSGIGSDVRTLDFKIGFKTAFGFDSGSFKRHRHGVIDSDPVSTSEKRGYRLEGATGQEHFLEKVVASAKGDEKSGYKWSLLQRGKKKLQSALYHLSPDFIFSKFFQSKKQVQDIAKELNDLKDEFIYPSKRVETTGGETITFIGSSILFVIGDKGGTFKLIDFAHPLWNNPEMKCCKAVKPKNHKKALDNYLDGLLNFIKDFETWREINYKNLPDVPDEELTPIENIIPQSAGKRKKRTRRRKGGNGDSSDDDDYPVISYKPGDPGNNDGTIRRPPRPPGVNPQSLTTRRRRVTDDRSSTAQRVSAARLAEANRRWFEDEVESRGYCPSSCTISGGKRKKRTRRRRRKKRTKKKARKKRRKTRRRRRKNKY